VPAWIGWILNWLWGKLIPIAVEFIRKLKRKNEIDKEEDAKKDVLEEARHQAQDWLRANPGQPLPKDLEDKLRDAADRNNGL
jgi:hypothetical protein